MRNCSSSSIEEERRTAPYEEARYFLFQISVQIAVNLNFMYFGFIFGNLLNIILMASTSVNIVDIDEDAFNNLNIQCVTVPGALFVIYWKGH